MRLTLWHYTCGHCGHDYALPGADLSFAYGTFLGVSPDGEAVVLDTVVEPIWGDLRALLEDDERTRSISAAELGSVLMAVVSRACDPDSRGHQFVFDGSPGCPACGSRSVARFAASDEPSPTVPGVPTTTRWEAMASEERIALARQVVEEMIDGS